jgi:hypothetical protein
MIFKKNKLVLRSNSELFIVNILSLKTRFFTILPSEQVFFTQQKDYNSSPSPRVTMKNGLTFVDSKLEHMGKKGRNKVIRLKGGNFLISFSYEILKIYWNVTKERIDNVFRIDHPSEVPSFLKKNILYSSPNINHLMKFYMKKLDLET